MRDVYITKSGSIKRKDNSLFLILDEQKYNLPINDIDNIFVFSKLSFNTDFFNIASKHFISIHFYNFYGFYMGSFLPKVKYPSGIILVNQVKYYSNPLYRIEIAKEIVLSSVHNMRKTLMQYSIQSNQIDKNIEKIKIANSIERLLLLEATSRKEYYSKFNSIIKNSDFEFITRSRNPPVDRLNSLISFGNSLLYNTVLSEISKTSIDPRISFLHEPFERRNSLNLDIADIFKPLIVDRVIFTLINKKMISLNDFDEKTDFCFLNSSGRKKFVSLYDSKLRETLKHTSLKRKVSYKYLIRLELYKLIKTFLENRKYKGFKISW